MALHRLTPRDLVEVAEGPSYEIHNEDGVGTRYDYFVEFQSEADHRRAGAGKRSRVFTLNHAFRQRDQAERMVAKINARGTLDLDHWIERETWSLEERWTTAGWQEYEVSLGMRDEADLYHGIPA